MSALTPIRMLLVLLLGLVAPYIWVESLFYWSLHVYPSMLKLLWGVFGLKGGWLVVLSSFLHSLVASTVFAVALRFIVQRAWLIASAGFCLAFLVALYGSEIFEGDSNLENQVALFLLSLFSVVVLLGSVVTFLALLSRYPRRDGV